MKCLIRYVRRRFALQLWGAMVVLICIGAAVSWIAHIFFFEPNYVRATTDRIINSIRPYIQVNEVLDESNADETLTRLSMLISGLVFLGDAGGNSIKAYSMGLPGLPPGPQEDKIDSEKLLEDPYIGESYRKVIAGETASLVFHDDEIGLVLVIGIPVTFDGEPCALFVSSTLSEIEMLQKLNRKRLLGGLVSMVLSASLLAVFFSRYFSKPVRSIRNTVIRLADGDLTAIPDVKREDELGQLSKSVEELARALQKVEVLRKELIANVSHELRAPLSLIIGYGEMVRDISGSDRKLRNEHLNLIVGEAERLSRIVDDILDYSQLQAGYIKPNLTCANLYDVVRSEAEFGRQVAASYDVDVSFESFSQDIPVDLDPIKMTHVLRNLINNAVNHTKGGASVDVAINEVDGRILVSVRNPGPVIPEEARELIWERYQRIQHQGGRREGSGIGLSIVSKVLSVHGFDYGVDSVDGTNVFWFAIGRKNLVN